MGRPGIMLYFDMLDPIRVLTDAERGKLLTAMLEYGKEGKKPTFRGKLALAWGFVMPKIDCDGEKYESIVTQRKYASFCKWCAERNVPKVSYERWQAMDESQRQRMLAAVCEPDAVADGRNPTTTAITNTTTNTSASGTTATDADLMEAEDASMSAAAAAERKKLKIWNGTLGKGVVNLTDEQTEILLDRMGLEQFDRYVAKLADFIIRTGANPRSHYTTILDWWNRDCAC